MKTLFAVLAALPLAVFAQSTGPGFGRGMGPGAGMGMGPGPGRGDPERMEKRARLARTLGLAEALDLDAPQALKLGEAISKFDERRLAAHKQLFEAHQALRKAAQGEKTSAGEVDQAIQKVLDARAQIHAVDREMVSTVTKDLAPEKKARAVLFLERFQRRFGPGPAARMGPGMRNGPGPGRGARRGPPIGIDPRMDTGPGPMAGACPGPDCDWELEEE
jgi:hypothetical protein